jgi:hypothetical protein
MNFYLFSIFFNCLVQLIKMIKRESLALFRFRLNENRSEEQIERPKQIKINAPGPRLMSSHWVAIKLCVPL